MSAELRPHVSLSFRNLKRGILLAAVLNVCAPGVSHAGANCLTEALAKIAARRASANSPISVNAQHLESLLGRKVSKQQKAKLEKVIQDFRENEEITSALGTRENRLLREAGYSPSEIDTLREAQVFQSGIIDTQKILPAQIYTVDAPLHQLTPKHIRSLQTGKPLTYVVDSNGKLFVSQNSLLPPEDSVLVVRDIASKTTNEAHLIHETGALRYNPEAKRFEFEPHHGWDLSKEELSTFSENVRKQAPELEFTRTKSAKVQESRHFDCLKIIENRQSGGSFVMDNLVAGNLITAGAIVWGEMNGEDRLSTPTGRKTIAADFIGGTITAGIGSVIGRSLILKDTGFVSELASRAVTGIGLVQVQDLAYKGALGDEKKDLSDDLTSFNRAHFAVRLPVNLLIDKTLMKKMPVTLYNACLKGGAVGFFLSPRGIRIYERIASAKIYYMLRSRFVEKKHPEPGADQKP
ncbi:MAG: hypothetical protein A2X94_00905 [Bdellovibrionales bacterium GWB1_55_8]|nr:MAG: hypothetical protein A2X94_00905 [Bdellovibrionales bacterium GWB1_55_8]